MDIGAELRQAREARGLSIEALSRSTRVQPRILSAIEQNDSVSIPPRPYGRGFVRAYASEVGLDPDGTVRDFFSQFGLREELPKPAGAMRFDEPTEGEKPWLWPVGAVLVYAMVGTLVIFAGRWILQTTSETGAVGTTGVAAPPPAPAVERRPAPVQAPPPAGVTILLEAERPTWVTGVADGSRTVYRILQAGERVALKADREVSIRTGDAGGVKWQVNGRDAGPMGASGEVRTVVITPENAATIK